MPVRIGLCLSLLRCACPYWAVPVFVTLCLSLLGCACLCYAVPVRVGLCLSVLGCACLFYAMPNRVQLCWPLRVPLLFRSRILTLIPLYSSTPRFIKSYFSNIIKKLNVLALSDGFCMLRMEQIAFFKVFACSRSVSAAFLETSSASTGSASRNYI